MTPAALLPPVQAPPHDPRAMSLSLKNLWGKARLKGLHVDVASGKLSLDASVATQRTLTESSGSFGGLVPPTNVAVTARGDIFLIDRREERLLRFDPCECRFDTVPSFRDETEGGARGRHLSGIGSRDGNLYICDRGHELDKETCAAGETQLRNPRLIVLSLRSFAPRAYWQPPRSAYTGSPPALADNWKPFDVEFDAGGRVYVSDPANECIHRFSSRGIWLGSFPGLGMVTHLAADCKDRLYAVIAGTARIKLIELRTGNVNEIEADVIGEPSSPVAPTTGGMRPEDLAPLFPKMPLRIDRENRLHLGALCAPPSASGVKCGSAEKTERGVFDLNGDSLTFFEDEGTPRFLTSGNFTTEALDSGIYRCVWHRIALVGEISEGAAIEIASFTSEIALSSQEVDDIFDQRQLTRRVNARIGADGSGDALIQGEPGRFLWLRLVFTGSSRTSPLLEHAEIEFPRISLRRFLPAVFGEEPVSADFTDRFLSLFDTTFRSVETKIDNFAHYFDPSSTPAARNGGKIDFLSWLASWVGIAFDRQWPEARRRRFLKRAGKLFPLRGTRVGLWSQLLIYLAIEPDRICCNHDKPTRRCTPAPYNCGPVVVESCTWQPPPLILEHFQLRRWVYLGMSRLQNEAVLWGRRIVNRSQLGDRRAQVGQTQLIMRPDPLHDPFRFYAHQFSVFVPARVGNDERERKGLENLLKAESPAHTSWTIHYVEPRFRIGFQSMIGLDSVVGRWPIGVRTQEARLGQGTVLSPSGPESGTVAFRVGDVRIGSSTNVN